MSDREICYIYKNSRDKPHQIKILAQLNACPRAKIENILTANHVTIEARKTWVHRKSVKISLDYDEVFGYYSQGMGDRKIGKMFGCSATRIYKWRHLHNLPSAREWVKENARSQLEQLATGEGIKTK